MNAHLETLKEMCENGARLQSESDFPIPFPGLFEVRSWREAGGFPDEMTRCFERIIAEGGHIDCWVSLQSVWGKKRVYLMVVCADWQRTILPTFVVET